LHERYPRRNIKVVNFGWISSSPILQLRLLRSIGEKYKPDLVVLAFDMGDFRNDLSANKMLEEEHGLTRAGEISVFHAFHVTISALLGVPNLYEWLKETLDRSEAPGVEQDRIPKKVFFHMFQPLAESKPYFELSWSTILQIHNWGKQRDAEFALVVYPRYPQHNRKESPSDWQRKQIPESDRYVLEAFKYFSEQAETVEFPIHSLLEAFQQTSLFPVCFENDPHWNRDGHLVAANSITELLIEDGYFDE
jgi:hypothetical protein